MEQKPKPFIVSTAVRTTQAGSMKNTITSNGNNTNGNNKD